MPHGGLGKVFTGAHAPSTLVRSCQVRQLDAVAARFLTGLAAATPLVAGVENYALVDIDDTTIIEVHSYGKQGGRLVVPGSSLFTGLCAPPPAVATT